MGPCPLFMARAGGGSPSKCVLLPDWVTWQIFSVFTAVLSVFIFKRTLK